MTKSKLECRSQGINLSEILEKAVFTGSVGRGVFKFKTFKVKIYFFYHSKEL